MDPETLAERDTWLKMRLYCLRMCSPFMKGYPLHFLNSVCEKIFGRIVNFRDEGLAERDEVHSCL